MTPLSIRKISLAHFRNYQDLCLTFDSSSVVLTGANGSGKTNLLEAISLLVPGKGLRRASYGDMQNKDFQESWGLATELHTASGLLAIGTGRDPQEQSIERRLVHIDGQKKRGQDALAEYVSMTWITPDMDRVLAESSSARRKLLDRLAYSFDPAHKGRMVRYEKSLRERMRLLRDGIQDATWFNALENEMAQTGVAIAAARQQLIRQLRLAIDETGSEFPRADLALKGFAEERLENQPALLVEDALRDALAQTRNEDARTGMCGLGPHRSDLLVTHRAKNCPASLCSTGEQKALLIALILATVRTLTRSRNMPPFLLLDDIAAHLDDFRRDSLFEEIRILGVQAWLTGTDTEPFTSLLPHAQHFVVEQGDVRRN